MNTKSCKQVDTKDLSGKTNGFLIEIASSLDGWSQFLDNAQIYLTTVNPKTKKGDPFTFVLIHNDVHLLLFNKRHYAQGIDFR